jgi:hypothetical protein
VNAGGMGEGLGPEGLLIGMVVEGGGFREGHGGGELVNISKIGRDEVRRLNL